LILDSVPGLTTTPRIPRLTHRPVLVAPPLLHLHAALPRTPEITEPVSILLPLRHKPSVALAAVHAAVAQRNIARLDVVVLDVGCTEATYRALSREYGDDPRVRLLDTACLPTGWSRSSHRCQQLAVGARGRILLFADPAAPLGPYAAAAGAALLRRQQLDLLVLDAGGRRRTGRFAVAADTEAYWRIGGHRAAAHDPHPLALLRAMRRAHAATGLADGRRVIPANTRVRRANLPAEPHTPYFLQLQNRDFADSTLGSIGTTARKLLAAFRATGVDLAGLGEPSEVEGASAASGVNGTKEPNGASGLGAIGGIGGMNGVGQMRGPSGSSGALGIRGARSTALGASDLSEMSARERAWLESTSAGGATGTLCADWTGDEEVVDAGVDAKADADAAVNADADGPGDGEKVQAGRDSGGWQRVAARGGGHRAGNWAGPNQAGRGQSVDKPGRAAELGQAGRSQGAGRMGCAARLAGAVNRAGRLLGTAHGGAGGRGRAGGVLGGT
jgi:hypothetical protein